MRDLGAGVFEDDEPPVNGRVGPGAPRTKLTCPACGLHDQAERADHPDFAFLCGACWTLFQGTDEEWFRLKKLREDVTKRRETPPAPLPPMRSHKTENVIPIQERLKEHNAE